MKLFSVFVTAAAFNAVCMAAGDVRKGTDVIKPDSAEAKKLYDSDQAVKTSPKDKTYADGLEGDKYKLKSPSGSQMAAGAAADTEELGVGAPDDTDVVSTDDRPVVLNDYDPNNLGVTSENRPETVADKTTEIDSKAKGEDKSGAGSVAAAGSGASGALSSSAGAGGASSAQTPFQAFLMAGSMIVFSEIGDKTFLIAALMAMKHPRITVFSAAFASLIVMTVLSAILGHALPALLPRKLTSLAACGLFIVFGAKLITDGLRMDAATGVDEELHEVEEEIDAKELELKNDDLERGTTTTNTNTINEKQLHRAGSSPSLSPDGLDDGTDAPLYRERPGRSAKPAYRQFTEGIANLAGLVLSPVWVQVFVMTFLGEWGDRSQVATIAMAAGSDYWFVILGAIAGHGLCSAAAVVGGRMLASKISLRTVTLSGGFCFIVFAIIYLIDGIQLPWDDAPVTN